MTKNLSLFSCIALALCSAAALGCAGEVADEDDPENIGDVAQALDLPDLIVQSYTQECLPTGINRTIVVKNQGTASAPFQSNRVYGYLAGCTHHPCFGAGTGFQGSALAAGATDTFISLQGTASGWTCTDWAAMNGTWQFTADPPAQITESDETNNVSTFPNTF